MDILHNFMMKFESVFTLLAFGKFVRLLQGFMQTHAPKALTELNSHLPQDSHFCGVYDFLNRYAWSHLDLAQRLLDWYVETLLQHQRLLLVVDDTKVFKRHARKMEGIYWHPEHHRRVQTRATTETGEEVTATGVVGEWGQQCCPNLYGSFVAYNWSFLGLFWVLYIVEKAAIGTVSHSEQVFSSEKNTAQKPFKPSLRLLSLSSIH